jgi:hypothetical protein
MTKVDKIGPEDWVAVDKIGRTEILGPAKIQRNVFLNL